MADLHLHLDGSTPDHASWSAATRPVPTPGDDFDDDALERAIRDARRAAYAALAELDAA